MASSVQNHAVNQQEGPNESKQVLEPLGTPLSAEAGTQRKQLCGASSGSGEKGRLGTGRLNRTDEREKDTGVETCSYKPRAPAAPSDRPQGKCRQEGGRQNNLSLANILPFSGRGCSPSPSGASSGGVASTESVFSRWDWHAGPGRAGCVCTCHSVLCQR
ncbi:hypothetical protein EYF80_020633 [Liparis tanakae]|uniref:Uncharacterized protein n=1 Tax=Liparis tanakae TaxID=230148 RepID=A0A4Z2HTI6_9TELE|nr:hypothetical protein EYF80_020633 [Liparis tanakae]